MASLAQEMSRLRYALMHQVSVWVRRELSVGCSVLGKRSCAGSVAGGICALAGFSQCEAQQRHVEDGAFVGLATVFAMPLRLGLDSASGVQLYVRAWGVKW